MKFMRRNTAVSNSLLNSWNEYVIPVLAFFFFSKETGLRQPTALRG